MLRVRPPVELLEWKLTCEILLINRSHIGPFSQNSKKSLQISEPLQTCKPKLAH